MKSEAEYKMLKQSMVDTENNMKKQVDECAAKLSEAESDHRKQMQDLLNLVNEEKAAKETNLQDVRETVRYLKLSPLS